MVIVIRSLFLAVHRLSIGLPLTQM